MANASAKGRKRTKTAAQHKRDGTFRETRHGEDDVQFSMGDPKPPAELNAAAKKEWKRVYPGLAELGMFTEADRLLFSVYCQSAADYLDLTRQLNKMKSQEYETKTGSRQPVPQIAMRQKAWIAMKEAASRFGLDPVSRIGLDVTPKKKGDKDETFLFGGPEVVK